MNKQRSFGILLQYLQMAISIIVTLISTPIILRILSKNEYGIYNLASSIIAYLSLLSLGFGSSYLRFFSRYKKDNDNLSIRGMNGLYLIVFSIMGIVVLIGGFILSSNANIFYNNTYTADEIKIAQLLMLILSINLAISFPMSVFVSYITAQERFIFQKMLNLGKTFFGPLVNIVFLYLGYGSIGMVVSTTVISIVIDLINVFFCLAQLKMQFSFKNPNFSLLKEIFVFSFFIALNQIIDQINWQTDKVILGKIINGTAVAIYSVGAQINTMFTSFSTAVSSIFAPKVNMIVQENKNDMDNELTCLFIKVGRIQWFIMFLILSGFIFFGQFFILKWAGDGYENAYWVALLLISPAIIPLIQNIGIEIQRAKNKHQFRSIVYLIMAVLNVGISIWFAMMWGEIGAAIGTTISLLVSNGLIMNIYYQKKLGINIAEFWKSIGKTLPGLIVPVLSGTALMVFYNFNTLLDFVLLAFGYTFFYIISIYFLGMNKDEKNMINNIFKKVFRK